MSFEFADLNILVLGGGVSGDAAARLLLDRGCRVTLADEGDASTLEKKITGVISAGGVLSAGKKELPDKEFDLCVASPAFAPGHPWLCYCRDRGIKVISELELGARCWRGEVLAVTGSKGKSSIVKLCSDTLNLSGVTASPAGNYGIPLSRLALNNPDVEWAVAEISSFQMENTACFSPDIAILLNVQPDHLDRHGSMECYKALKFKLFEGMSPGALALVNESLDIAEGFPLKVELSRFGVECKSDWHWRSGEICGLSDGDELKINLTGSWFDNAVFGVSAAAACAALLRTGLSIGQIEEGLQKFQPLEHRMEMFYRSSKGVVFVNDSKATSLSATAAALKMAEKPVRLIAGGLLKEKLTENIKELLTQSVKKVYLIGNCSEQMFQSWSDAVSCVKCDTLKSAVRHAAEESEAGETVLLSPGTASFDQFKNYCERGECFKDLVREVAN